MIRKKNRFSRPKKPFESTRITEENKLRAQYGLKNKKEIWKSVAKITYYRTRAKALAKSPVEEQEVLIRKLKALGFKVNTLMDILDLRVEDILNRRITTIVSSKGLANTPRHARQMVVHKKIRVAGQIVNVPSYIVPVDKENQIELVKKEKVKKAAPVEEVAQ